MLQRGFSLVDIMITVAIIAMFFGIGALAVSVASARFAERSAEVKVHDLLSSAQRMARSGVEDSSWGVYIPYDETTRRTESVVLFAGDNYASRNVSLDIVQPIPNYIQFTNVKLQGANPSDGNDHEIVFEKVTGNTDNYGKITVDVYSKTIIVQIFENGFEVEDAYVE